MRIGIDFDNTIACYDQGFLTVAVELGLVPKGFAGGKKAIRDHVRLGPGGDHDWQRLQARLYGPDIGHAHLMEGVGALLERLKASGIPVVIVSHKTRTSPLDPHTDLRQAALGWMRDKGLFDRYGIDPGNVYFEATRDEKIRRIAGLDCTHFIDDLEEVFLDPAFPSSVRPYLFAAGYDRLPQGPYTAFFTHGQIGDHLLGADPAAIAALLLKAPPRSVEVGNKGGNNRLYKVVADDGLAMAMKCYPAVDGDPRDRLGTEWTALKFLSANGETAIPAPKRMDASMRAALYQWIDGDKIAAPGPSDVEHALAFCARLHGYRHSPGAEKLPMASEACVSDDDILRQVDRRLTRLRDSGEISGMVARIAAVRNRYDPAGAGVLDRSLWSLSPSDFGFHNALRRADGSLVFLDFEYFGWDDPVKLTADTMMHPGYALTDEGRGRFADGMAKIHRADPDFLGRLRRQLPLYVLRWSLILLSEFLPERWARRQAAGETDHAAAKTRQLAKAEALFSQIDSVLKDVP